MDEMPKVNADGLLPVVREQIEEAVKKIMQAVNEAPPGELITAREEAAREIEHELTRAIYASALQQRVTAAEAAFSPPQEKTTGRPLRNKGRQLRTVLCVCGRVQLRRTWWHSPESGSVAPLDDWIMRDGSSVTLGVREMACRLNNDAASFEKASDNLRRAAQIRMSAEQLRLVVEEEGRRVIAAQQAAAIPTAFTARDCPVPDAPGQTRMYAVWMA